jgi:hypothetical protein
MLKKPLVIATLATAVGLAAISTKAEAGDPVLGALIGGGIGAAIGHSANGHNGAAVGGVLGAIVGSSVAANSGPYYGDGYYGGDPYYAPAPAYYPPAPAYYPPAPVYYEPAYAAPSVGVVFSSYPHYDHRYVRHDYRGHRDGHHH